MRRPKSASTGAVLDNPKNRIIKLIDQEIAPPMGLQDAKNLLEELLTEIESKVAGLEDDLAKDH